ncbi:MAG TPA: aminoglycoside phosphotransferase family protein [Nitrospirae bacterium]|nr:aminoglycoside phosphotransferase family protein [Nitrospirota bacterium]HDZ01197.1 aminoglycoside phosphotransferase family protein [Nitrospirota bacterium]
MINKKSIERYIKNLFHGEALGVDIKKLGEGVQGAGFLVEVKTRGRTMQYVIKGLFPEGLEHDYPADRAGVFLLDLEEFRNLPQHVKAVDVLSEMEDGSIKSIGGGREYYLLMERAKGKHYFNDLAAFSKKERLEPPDIEKIRSMTSYLARIHSVRKDSRHLYWRKVRDTIGHGECLMGVFDTYPDGTISYDEMAAIEKKCIDWRVRLKPKFRRLCQVHGDFHPGNIWFQNNRDFILLDRSRGPWGDAADDVTALTINYIFFSINNSGRVQGPYLEALNLFYDRYIDETGDNELFEVLAPFYAFRGAVVANPVFYPDVSTENRHKIISFVHGVLDDESFRVDKVNEYIKTR